MAIRLKTIYISIIIIISYNYNACGQVYPRDHSKINYTQVMFEYPEIKKALYYIVQIAINSEPKLFEKNIVIEQVDSTTATLINGLKFGTSYQWRYIAFNKEGNIINISDRYFFNILKNNLVDENYNSYRINTKIVDDGLIFLDISRVAINRSGEPVWFLPNKSKEIWDIKMTKSGTITFLSKVYDGSFFDDGIEVSINGETIWKTPHSGIVSGDSIEHFHHDFKKLNNGNYMIIGNKFVKPKNKLNVDFIAFGTIIEYDSNHNVVWSWDSQNAFSDTDIYYPTTICDNFYSNVYNYTIYDPAHINAFYLDEKEDMLYVSARFMSRIIKIEKKTGKIVANFGEKWSSGEAKYANDFFYYQHSSILLPDGNIAVFNNNNVSDTGVFISSVVVFSQPNAKSNISEKIWEFSCDFDSLYAANSLRFGNIIYMNNSNFLVNMGRPVSRIFEVTQDKKIVWDCYAEKYSNEKNQWVNSNCYRASYTKSLYPIYFTLNNSIEQNKNLFKKNKHVSFKINNEGSEPDKYTIKYNLDKSCKITSSDEVLPNKSININIELQKENIKNNQVTITVSSFANPEFKKEIKFYVE